VKTRATSSWKACQVGGTSRQGNKCLTGVDDFSPPCPGCPSPINFKKPETFSFFPPVFCSWYSTGLYNLEMAAQEEKGARKYDNVGNYKFEVKCPGPETRKYGVAFS